MVLREEQERLQLLLREAIPMMCKNGVPYQTEFCVEALIGITIDKSDVVLVSIKETFNKDGAVCQTPEKSPKKRRRKRRKSNSSKQSDVSSGDSDNDQSHPQGGSDGDSYPEPARKTMKPDPNYDDYEDNEDELVTIKSEPVNIQGDHSEYEQGDQTFDTFTTTQSPTQNPQNSEFPWTCGICEKLFKSKSNAQRHMKTRHGPKTQKCKSCDKQFARTDELQQHMQVHSGLQFDCDICGMTYRSNKTLLNHKRFTHANEPIPYGCDICSRKYKTKHALEMHSKVHKSKQKCKQCDQYFIHLEQHVKRCHNTHRSKCVFCPYCKEGFIDVKYMNEHVKLKHGNKKYSCSKCGGAFTYRTQLHRHADRCTGDSKDNIPVAETPLNHVIPTVSTEENKKTDPGPTEEIHSLSKEELSKHVKDEPDIKPFSEEDIKKWSYLPNNPNIMVTFTE